MINMTDLFVTIMQGFLVSSLMCKHFKTKYSYKTSLLLHMAGMQLQYFVMNYGIFQYELRMMIGFSGFCIMSFFIFDGTCIRKVILGLGEYLFLLVMDLINYLFVYPWMGLSFENDIYISSKLLLARNTFNFLIYLVLVLMEFFRRDRENKLFFVVTCLSMILAVSQLHIMKILYQSNSSGALANAVIISVFYSTIVIMGYFMIKELFEQIVWQQDKQAEIEQLSLEKQYQYDYYQKALAQGERLRDMRHDMRNQLQTASCLLCSETDEDRKRAEEMLGSLAKKMD